MLAKYKKNNLSNYYPVLMPHYKIFLNGKLALSPIEVKAITEHFSDIDRQKIDSNTVPPKAIQKKSAELIKN